MDPSNRHSCTGSKLLKRDTFGSVLLCTNNQGSAFIVRDTRSAMTFAGPLARWLMRREARALGRLPSSISAPQLIWLDKYSLARTFVEGQTMYEAKPSDRQYFTSARKALHRLHRANISHNDLAKEPNRLVDPAGQPALVDFQLASVHRKRSALFRLPSRIWRSTGKRLYWFVTRRILHWADREGAADRGRSSE